MMLELLNQLCSLTAGLSWMSESDYPFEAFIWDDLTRITPEKLCTKTGHSPDTSVQVVELDRFCKRAVKEEDWHNEEEVAEVKRYQAMVETMLMANFVPALKGKLERTIFWELSRVKWV